MFNHSSASASTPAPEFFSLEPAATTPGTPVSIATSSVIVRTSQELGGFPPTPQWSATGTPTGYPSYPTFPFFFPPPDFNNFFPPSTESCSTGTSNLQSPILQGGALDLGHGLNPLNRFPNYGRGVGLPYSDLSVPLMGSQKQHKGGRRPREEMTRNSELDDPDEAEKKLKRRQRNKEAAARCRQRRLDLMEQLQSHVDRLKGENDGKEREIKNMSDKLNRLVDFIRKHQCNLSSDDLVSLDGILSSSGTGSYVNNSGNGNSQHYDRGSVSSGSSVSIVSDYAPQNPPVSRPSLGPPSHPPPKRHYPTSMPPTSAPDDLEPDTKLSKMLTSQSELEKALDNINATASATANVKEELLDPEMDKIPRLENYRNPTLAEVNCEPDQLQRPGVLMGVNLSSTMANNMPIVTPSREIMSAMPSAPQGNTPAFDIFGNSGLLGQQSTGLTPSVQPQINFVNVMQTPTPLAQESEYRSL